MGTYFKGVTTQVTTARRFEAEAHVPGEHAGAASGGTAGSGDDPATSCRVTGG